MSDDSPTGPPAPRDGDTPTERFTPAGGSFTEQFLRPGAGERLPPTDDAPTERFVAATVSSSAPAGSRSVPPDEKRQRRLIVILAIIGGLLLLAVIIVLVVLLTRGGTPIPVPTPSGSPTSSATPTPTPTPTPTSTPTPTPTSTPTPPPPTPSAAVNDFTVDPETVECASSDDAPTLDISWDTSDADQVFFGVDTPDGDASTSPLFSGLPASGSSAQFPAGYNPFTFTCSADSHSYTITAVGADDSKDSVTIEVEAETD